MTSAKPVTLESERSVADVFAALLAVVQGGKYDLAGVSNEMSEMLFTSGKTAFSWGHVFVASVVERGAGSVLQLTVAVVPGAPKSLMDGRKNRKAGEGLVAAVSAALSSSTAPTPAPVESFARTADGGTVPWTAGEYPGA